MKIILICSKCKKPYTYFIDFKLKDEICSKCGGKLIYENKNDLKMLKDFKDLKIIKEK